MPNQFTGVSAEGRYWAKVDKAGPIWNGTSCWLWQGATAKDGYGRFWLRGHLVLSHRLAYELLVGPIPEGLTIDHLCRTRSCGNPLHLEPVTNKENIMRGEGVGVKASHAIHCPKGHPYDLFNTFFCADGSRQCRECQRIFSRQRRQRLKSAVIKLKEQA